MFKDQCPPTPEELLETDPGNSALIKKAADRSAD